jgi:SAM-dependent methyltransferase
MSERPFRRIRSSTGAPDGEAFLADLVDFHAERPAVTEATLGALRTSGGRTGYDVVVDAVSTSARSVVELGCGNGPLLEALLRARPALTSVVGVDACAPELDLARRRIDDTRLRLSCSPAQTLDVPDASVDAVVSHHAFYLFVPIEPVIAEIARVLRPGGRFVFMTTSLRPMDPSSVLAQLYAKMNPHTSAEVPQFRGWGDRRVWSIAGLEELFFASGAPFAPPLAIDELVVSIREAPATLCDRLMRFFYTVALQKAVAREELRRDWLAVLSTNVDERDEARFDLPSACVTVTHR